MRINGHGHVLPEPNQIPKFMKDKKLFWIDNDKKFMRQGNWSRPITGSSLFDSARAVISLPKLSKTGVLVFDVDFVLGFEVKGLF